MFLTACLESKFFIFTKPRVLFFPGFFLILLSETIFVQQEIDFEEFWAEEQLIEREIKMKNGLIVDNKKIEVEINFE